MFIDALDVDDVIAHLLVTEGFSSVEEVAFVPVEDLAEIEGFEESIAEELRNRAQAFLSEQEEKLTARRKELGVDDSLSEIEALTVADLVKLGEKGVKTLDDLADLASDELIEIVERKMTNEDANAIIMAARAHWFADEPAASDEAGTPTGQA
jgi:N utilization substance protein A